MYLQSVFLPVEQRGFSSITGTEFLTGQLPALFKKYNINSIFDAGANDCSWQKSTLAKMVKTYYAGDHNLIAVETAKSYGIESVVHNVVKDPFPSVDALFVRDVAIHLNNNYKKQMIQNWLDSKIPWLLITQSNGVIENKDFQYLDNEFPMGEVNWTLPPWNFPTPVDFVVDLWANSTRHMSLWNREQICQ